MRASVKTPNLSGLSGTVHMGRARRQMLDTEFENVVKSSSAQVASHPFTKGEYNNFKHNVAFLQNRARDEKSTDFI